MGVAEWLRSAPGNQTFEGVEVLGWQDFLTFMDWGQGEHVTLIGHTGSGKTELSVKLLEQRRYVVFLGTKSQDSTQTALKGMGYRVVNDSTGIEVDVAPHIIVRPDFNKKLSAKEVKVDHQELFRETIMRVYRQGGWTLDIDETRYITEFLGLRDECMLCWLQGRSKDISVLAATQRPRFVPLEAYDSASHLFFWRSTDLENVKRVGELAGINREVVTRIVARLPKHDVLYVDTRTGRMAITNTRS
jgi:hypothetical protein